MKPILILTCFLLFANGVFAQQNIDSTFAYAQRGKVVVLTFKVKRGPSLCELYSSYYLWKADDTSVNGLIYVEGSVLNDSMLTLSCSIPNVLRDGQVLSLKRTRNPYWNNEDGCDSIMKDTAVIVMGGAYAPGFYSLTPDTIRRGATHTIRVDAKGLKLKGKRFASITLNRLDEYQPYYEMYISGPVIPNDSQGTMALTVPKDLPDGKYETRIHLNEAGASPKCYATLVVDGGKNIPTLESVLPDVIGRGEQKEITIRTHGTEFLAYKPQVQIGGKNIENITVVNDSTVKCDLKISTVDSGYKEVWIGSTYDGWLLKDSAILVSGGKPYASLRLDHDYIVQRGQKVKLLIHGEHTHFTQQGSLIELGRGPWYDNIDSIEVMDSVTMLVNLKVDDEFLSIYNFGHSQLTYTDSEMIDPVAVGGFVVVVPDETQSYVSKMEPVYFHRNSVEEYKITIRNVQLTLCDEDNWQIYAYSTPGFQYGNTIEHRIENDSTIVCKIEFDEYFTETQCALSLRYHSAGGYVWMESFLMTNLVNTGLVENNSRNHVSAKVYPNPVKDKLLIENGKNILNCTLMTLTGKEISINPALMNLRDGQLEVDIATMGLENGLYFVRIEMVNGVACQKIVISRQ